MIEFRLITDKPTVPSAETDAIGALVLDVIAFAKPLGPKEFVANALLGAYLTFAQNTQGIDFEKCVRSMVESGQLILNQQAQAKGPIAPEDIVRVTDDLSARIGQLLVDERHEVALGALLSLFRSVAVRSPCCTAGAAFAAAEVAGLLSTHAAKTVPTGPLH